MRLRTTSNDEPMPTLVHPMVTRGLLSTATVDKRYGGKVCPVKFGVTTQFICADVTFKELALVQFCIGENGTAQITSFERHIRQLGHDKPGPVHITVREANSG